MTCFRSPLEFSILSIIEIGLIKKKKSGKPCRMISLFSSSTIRTHCYHVQWKSSPVRAILVSLTYTLADEMLMIRPLDSVRSIFFNRSGIPPHRRCTGSPPSQRALHCIDLFSACCYTCCFYDEARIFLLKSGFPFSLLSCAKNGTQNPRGVELHTDRNLSDFSMSVIGYIVDLPLQPYCGTNMEGNPTCVSEPALYIPHY